MESPLPISREDRGFRPSACEICGSELAPVYPRVRDSMTNEEFALYRCAECGIGHTLPRPQDMLPYYAATYYGNRHGFIADLCMERRRNIVLSAMKGLEGKRLLDIGCGDGSFIRNLRDAGWDVAGTEMHPDREALKGLSVKRHAWEFPEHAPFDCVTMWHTLEHMQNVHATLARVHALLKPGGRLIVAVPNYRSFQSVIFRNRWLHLDVPRHLYHFHPASLQRCLTEQGFVICRQGYQELEYDLLGWTQSALNCIFAQPNVLFDILRGRQTGCSSFTRMLNLVLGLLFVALSLPAVLAERLFSRSGTIITIAGRDEKNM